ncbi:hypothetical protein EV361DRAFT_908934 [Lentinula raphanica]|uniref:Uncharacterized protein n=1 Tax=Lentinula raphanica TaxID=153919 RepID=A0AA38UMJ7_9AGAR|nr:hypothetical protein F5878DRAFT_602498 [Lentinula raphanica]KAJ3971846.1 hypothetical protein EV361DRAFT_908934 [Lentinula raphanica]
MRLKASDDAGPGEEVPVMILTLGTKRKFMATPDDYTDLVRVVKRKFNLPNGSCPTFHARAPTNPPSDNLLEIDDSAYPLMKRFLGEVEIVVEEDVATQTQEEIRPNDDKGKEKTTDTPPVSPLPSLIAAPSKSTTDNQPPSDAGSSNNPTTVAPSRPKPAPVSIPNPPPDLHNIFNDDVDVEYASPTKKKPTKTNGLISKSPVRDVFDVDADEYEAPSVPQPTSSTKANLDTRTVNPPKSTPDSEEVATKSRNMEDEEGNHVSKHVSKVPETNYKRSVVNADEDLAVVVKKERPSQPSASPARSKASTNGTHIHSVNKHPPTLSPQKTDGPIPLSQSQSHSQTSASVDPEPRFKIKIFGPRSDQTGEFMTRKKHTVRKVLAGACKNFGIDPTTAKLQQIFELPEGDDDEIVSHYYDCDNDETVGKAGIGPESMLRVYVQGADDEYEDDHP